MTGSGGDRVDRGWKAAHWARAYLRGIRGGIPLAAEQLDVMMRVLEAAVPKPERLLDLGSGDGVLAETVLDRHPGAEAVLVDFSEPMLEEAKKRFSGTDKLVTLVKADFSTPDWVELAEKDFDAVVSGYAIHHQTDERKRAIYGEVFSLLRPGGVFLNMEHVASATPWVRGIAESYFNESLERFRNEAGGEEFSAEELAERRDKEANVLARVEEQITWLEECGFTDVDCFFKVFELALFGGRRP